MKWIVIFFAVLIGGSIELYTLVKDGRLIQYFDSHPHPKYVPPVEYMIGQGLYLGSDLQNSATYYLRIAERYPKSPLADDAYYNYLQSLDDMGTSRWTMADAYESYLDRFPNGKHVDIVKKRVEYCRNSR